MLRRGLVVGIVHDYLVYVHDIRAMIHEMTSFLENEKSKPLNERSRHGGRDFIDTGRNICSDNKGRSLNARYKVAVDLSL